MRLLLAVCAVIGLAAPASAAGVADAQAFVNTASQAFRKGDFKAALEALRKAEPIVEKANDPTLAAIRFNIARCLQELGQGKEALAAYDRYLKVPDESGRKGRAQAAIKSLKRTVFGGMTITCEPAGAMVTVPGVIDIPTACPVRKLEVEPGTYSVKIAFDGYTPESREIEVQTGDPAALTVALTKKASVTMPDMDGPIPEAAGDPWPWVWTGGGALAILGGVALSVSAIGDRDEAEGLQPGRTRDDLVDAYQRNETLSWVAYGFGGAALLTGIFMLSADDDEPAQAGWHLTGNGVKVQW